MKVLRAKVKINLRKPLNAVHLTTTDKDEKRLLQKMEDIIKDLLATIYGEDDHLFNYNIHATHVLVSPDLYNKAEQYLTLNCVMYSSSKYAIGESKLKINTNRNSLVVERYIKLKNDEFIIGIRNKIIRMPKEKLKKKK